MAQASRSHARFFGSEPIQVWQDYLAFHATERGANFLPKAFADEYFAFNSGVLSGTPQHDRLISLGAALSGNVTGGTVLFCSVGLAGTEAYLLSRLIDSAHGVQ